MNWPWSWFRKKPSKTGWEFIGDADNPENIPSWVLGEFGSIPGSHGTMVVDHPELYTGKLYFEGRTFRYCIDLDDDCKVYRRLRRKRRANRTKGQRRT